MAGITRFDTIVVGGGPAGASCALWLKRLGLSPVIVERARELGGLQRTSPYPNQWILGQDYASGDAFADAVTAQLRSHDVEIRLGQAMCAVTPIESGFYVRLESSELTAPFLVLATGVRPRLPEFAVNAAIIVGPGKCVQDADLRGKRIAILGGGDNAFENYGFIREKGAAKIKIFARNIRAQHQLVAQVPLTDIHLGPYTALPDTLTVNGETFDHFVVLYGWEATEPFKDTLPLKMQNGFIAVDSLRKTSLAGVYAIGEVAGAVHPCCVSAMADGVIAAKDIHQQMDRERNRSVVQALKAASTPPPR